MSVHDDAMRDLVAAHALGAVDAATQECQTVREHLRECAICREEYRVARAAATALALAEAQPPPAALRQRVLAGLTPQAAPQNIAALHPMRRSWIPAMAAAAVVLLIAGLLLTPRHPQQQWAMNCMPGARNCQGAGMVTMAAHRMHVAVNGLAMPPSGMGYQAWLIVPGGKPVPEPMVHVDASGSGGVDIAAASAPAGTVVALTVEPSAGSQAPTSKPFMAATID